MRARACGVCWRILPVAMAPGGDGATCTQLDNFLRTKPEPPSFCASLLHEGEAPAAVNRPSAEFPRRTHQTRFIREKATASRYVHSASGCSPKLCALRSQKCLDQALSSLDTPVATPCAASARSFAARLGGERVYATTRKDTLTRFCSPPHSPPRADTSHRAAAACCAGAGAALGTSWRRKLGKSVPLSRRIRRGPA